MHDVGPRMAWPGGVSTRGIFSVCQVAFGFGEVLGPAEIAPVRLIGAKGEDRFTLSGETEVGGDDGEGAFLGQVGEDAWRKDLNATEAERVDRSRRDGPLGFSIATDAAARELALLVEEKIARGLALLNGQGGESVVFGVKADHARKIDGAEDIDVVDDERLLRAFAGFQEKPGGFLEATAGIEQDLLAGDFNTHAEVAIGLEVIEDFVGEVMDIENDFADAEGTQAAEGELKESTAGDGDQRFGAFIGERTQARAQACGENHRLHLLCFPQQSKFFELDVSDDNFDADDAAQMIG